MLDVPSERGRERGSGQTHCKALGSVNTALERVWGRNLLELVGNNLVPIVIVVVAKKNDNAAAARVEAGWRMLDSLLYELDDVLVCKNGLLGERVDAAASGDCGKEGFGCC